MSHAPRRVAVTGIGLRSPIGNSPGELADALKNDRTGVVAMPEWDQVASLRTKVAGVCQRVEESEIPRHFRRSMGRVSILAALAAQEAIADSGLALEVIGSPRCGLSFGSTAGSSRSLEKFLERVISTRSLKGLQASTFLHFMSHTCAANLSQMFAIKGPIIASCTACVAGSQGIGFAYQAIRYGQADVMLGGGAEEMHYMDAGIFDIMRATSTEYNSRPELTPRPFDADRDGLVVGEGAGCLVLEEYEHATRRGARIWAEVLGFGNNSDGTHLTNPSSTGMAGAMRLAIEDAGIRADQIQHVNAHATATEAGDMAEAEATYNVFGDSVPVSALKGYMGHTLGASGAIESIASLVMLQQGFIPPTRNLERPDPRLAPIQHVMGAAREAKLSIVMNNNFAFGGINNSLIFRS
jgi:3-oxoacyl-[acyl-carrier-protein] synthase II